MNVFNFGDLVKSRAKPDKRKGVVVANGSNQYSVIVRWENEGGGVSQEHVESLELIPHPDTARLNWLEKKMLEDSDQIIVCDGYNGFCTLGNFRENRLPTFENIREAIDHEMKKQGD